jgi:hypothetical protein
MTFHFQFVRMQTESSYSLAKHWQEPLDPDHRTPESRNTHKPARHLRKKESIM